MLTRKKAVFLGAGLFAILLFGGMAYLLWLIRFSQPVAGLGARVPGLSSEVKIDQDALGVPTIHGQSLEDIYRGQGWITARDRLFQMDLIRRKSAGRLSEIVGPATVELDTFHRKLGLTGVANRAIFAMPTPNRKLFEAYAEGVNAFMASGAPPFEVRVLGYTPEPWRAEDSLLVVLAMFCDSDILPQLLAERAVTALYERRPKSLADFLTPITGFLDTPLLPDKDFAGPRIPADTAFDVRKEPARRESNGAFEPILRGSNAWALSGKFTHSGLPILAGDPHLDLYAPNVWYRNRLEGDGVHVTGVSLPGFPGIVIGDNGKVAWSITNPSGDTLDLAKLSTGDTLRTRRETLRVKGEVNREVDVKDSAFGPVIRREGETEYALQWTALDSAELARIDTVSVLRARNSEEFLQALAAWKGPVSNLVFATREGDIGWALAGNLPSRVGFDGRTSTFRDETHYWKGYIAFGNLPKVLNPVGGYIVSANQRLVSTSKTNAEVRATANNLVSPDRAYRIRQRLEQTRGKWTVEDSFSIQNDLYSPTAVFFAEVLKKPLARAVDKEDAWIKAIGALIENWNGFVTADSSVYPFIRPFRRQLIANLVEPLWGTEELDEPWINDRSAVSYWYYVEPVVKTLLETQPAHLLSPRFHSYDEAILAAAVKVAQELVKRPEDLKSLHWGDFNRTRIPHPFSAALPAILGSQFNLPDEPIGGTFSTPRAASYLFGRFHSASMRMVVELGDSRKGIFNHPGGQSGHFRSPHYRDQFTAWLKGEPTPFEPGPSVIVDTLRP